MYAETQKLHLIEELLKVDDADILKQIELVLAKNNPGHVKRKSFKTLIGMLSVEEADELERIIEEGCEQINEDDWK